MVPPTSTVVSKHGWNIELVLNSKSLPRTLGDCRWLNGPYRFNRQKPRSRMHMMKNFEDTIKRTFTDKSHPDTFHCPVAGMEDNPEAGVEDGFLTIRNSDMREIFDPIINQVVRLVDEQVESVESLKRKVSVCPTPPSIHPQCLN